MVGAPCVVEGGSARSLRRAAPFSRAVYGRSNECGRGQSRGSGAHDHAQPAGRPECARPGDDDGLRAALERARDLSIRAVILTGAGSGFCSGQDLQELSKGAPDVADSVREGVNRAILAIRALEKPVLAAVNGPAAGGGLSLALACDIRIASEEAVFVPAFLGVGLAPDAGATWLPQRILGAARAFEWLTTGRRLTAAEALQWGLVSEVVPAAELAPRAPRSGRALRGDADARRLGDEAAARRGRDCDPRAATRARSPLARPSSSRRPTSPRASQRSRRSGRPHLRALRPSGSIRSHSSSTTTSNAGGSRWRCASCWRYRTCCSCRSGCTSRCP